MLILLNTIQVKHSGYINASYYNQRKMPGQLYSDYTNLDQIFAIHLRKGNTNILRSTGMNKNISKSS